MDWLLTRKAWVRLGSFAGVFATLALWKVLAPRRALSVGKVYRWANNLGILTLDTLAVRLVFPAAAVGIALFAEY